MEQEKKVMNLEQLLQTMTEELGKRSDTMEFLGALNEKAVFEHAANKNFAMSGEYIPLKYKLLMSLAISAALGIENCIETYTTVALRKGITKEEIMETILLTRFVKGTTVISQTTSAMKMVLDHNK